MPNNTQISSNCEKSKSLKMIAKYVIAEFGTKNIEQYKEGTAYDQRRSF